MRFLLFLAFLGGLAFMSYNQGWIGPGNDDGGGGDQVLYGPIFDEPQGYRTALLADPWVTTIPTGDSTFAKTMPRQVRIEFGQTGRTITQREVTLQTPPAVKLFEGKRRETAI